MSRKRLFVQYTGSQWAGMEGMDIEELEPGRDTLLGWDITDERLEGMDWVGWD